MRPTIYLSSIFIAGLTFASAKSDYPACVEQCIDAAELRSSYCDGDESGSALERCTCIDYSNSSVTEFVAEKCSPSDQGAYAQNIPTLCRDELLPNATTPTGAGSTGATPSSTTEASSETDAATDAAVAMDIPGAAIIGGLLAVLLL